MARFICASAALPKCGYFAAVENRSPWRSRNFVSMMRRHIVTTNSGTDPPMKTATSAVKQGIDEMQQTGQDAQNMGTSAAATIKHEIEDKTSEISGKAQELMGKAKQAAQDAWEPLKETPKKMADTICNTADETKEFVKENAKKVERSMNSKN